MATSGQPGSGPRDAMENEESSPSPEPVETMDAVDAWLQVSVGAAETCALSPGFSRFTMHGPSCVPHSHLCRARVGRLWSMVSPLICTQDINSTLQLRTSTAQMVKNKHGSAAKATAPAPHQYSISLCALVE